MDKTFQLEVTAETATILVTGLVALQKLQQVSDPRVDELMQQIGAGTAKISSVEEIQDLFKKF